MVMNLSLDRINTLAAIDSQTIMAQAATVLKMKVFLDLIRIVMNNKEELPESMIATRITEIQIHRKTAIITETNLQDTKNIAAEVHIIRTVTMMIEAKKETGIPDTAIRIKTIITKFKIRLCQPDFLYNLKQLL